MIASIPSCGWTQQKMRLGDVVLKQIQYWYARDDRAFYITAMLHLHYESSPRAAGFH